MPQHRQSKDLPADVARYVQEGEDAGMDPGKAHAIAWSRFCAYKSPGHESCSGEPGDYFPGRKAAEIRVAYRFLTAGAKLPPAVKTKINALLRQVGMDGNGRFKRVGDALNDIGTVLSEKGIEWDDTLNSHLFMADSGRVNLHLALSNAEEPMRPTSLDNTVLAFHWTLMEGSGLFEILAYVS